MWAVHVGSADGCRDTTQVGSTSEHVGSTCEWCSGLLKCRHVGPCDQCAVPPLARMRIHTLHPVQGVSVWCCSPRARMIPDFLSPVQGVGVWSGPGALGHGAVLRPRHPPLLVRRPAVPLAGQGGGVQEVQGGGGGELERGEVWEVLGGNYGFRSTLVIFLTL